MKTLNVYNSYALMKVSKPKFLTLANKDINKFIL